MRRFLFIIAALLTSVTIYAANDIKRPDTYNYNRGLEELRNNNYDGALEYFNKEVAADPKNGYAYSWIAMIREYQEEYGRALTAADLALKNLPKKDIEFLSATYNIRAGVYLNLEDTVKAMSDYATSIKVAPKVEATYEKRAQIYFEQGNYALADADYNMIKSLNQGSVMGYMGIGRNLKKQEKWEDAIKEFTYVTNLYSDYSQAFAYRAECYIGLKEWAKATDDIVTALSIDRSDAAFYLMQDLEESAFGMLVAKFKIQSAKNPNEAVWPYYSGIMYERKSKFAKAIEYYESANKIDLSPYNYKRISNCYSEMGEYKRAIEAIDKAIEIDSTQTSYLVTKANLYHEAGDTKAAIEAWDKYLQSDPEESFGYYRRGWFKSLVNDVDGAIEDETMCITLDPEYAYAYVTRGELYKQQGKKELADEDFKKVIELENTPDKYECIHYAYHGLGQDDKAIEAIDTIIGREKEKKGAYYDAACLYSRMENKEKALEYLEKSLSEGYVRFNHIRADHDMDFIRNTQEFIDLLNKYEKKEENANNSADVSGGKETTVSEVPFTKENGICNVKCQINGLPLYFVFDTGASIVSLSMVEATFMMKNGYLNSKDVVGSQYFQDANGNVSEGTTINLREVDFGGHKLQNVKASVVRNQKAPLLLGQSVLSRLGKIEIDNSKAVLKITSNK